MAENAKHTDRFLTEIISIVDRAKAEEQAAARQGRRDAAGNKNAHNSDGGIDRHIVGTLGEKGFSLISGRPLTSWDKDMDEDDDVDGIEVKTRKGFTSHLTVFVKDIEDGSKDDVIFAFMKVSRRDVDQAGSVECHFYGYATGKTIRTSPNTEIHKPGKWGRGRPQAPSYVVDPDDLVIPRNPKERF